MKAWLIRNKIIFETLVAASLIAVGLWACAAEPVFPILPETETQEQTTWQPVLRDPIEIRDEGQNWTVFAEENGGNIYTVFDHDGNEIYREYNWRDPHFFLENKNLLTMMIGTGTGAWDTVFFDLVQGRYSPAYPNLIASGYGKVFYTEWIESERKLELIVHDVFDITRNRSNPQLDFHNGSFFDLPPEIQEEIDILRFTGIRTAEFLSATQLRVEYLNSNAEFVTETLDLK